jgi:hypothetical protein
LDSGSYAEDIGIEDIDIEDNREHGLGMYLNPVSRSPHDAKRERDWVTEAWVYMIQTDLGMPAREPSWFDQIAMRKLVVSTWSTYERLQPWNENKPYQEQIKPYNFIMTFAPLFRPESEPKFRLVAPFSSKPEEWKTIPFRNLYNPYGPDYWIDGGSYSGGISVPVPTFRTVIRQYLSHPESKFNDADGQRCAPNTRGAAAQTCPCILNP